MTVGIIFFAGQGDWGKVPGKLASLLQQEFSKTKTVNAKRSITKHQMCRFSLADLNNSSPEAGLNPVASVKNKQLVTSTCGK